MISKKPIGMGSRKHLHFAPPQGPLVLLQNATNMNIHANMPFHSSHHTCTLVFVVSLVRRGKRAHNNTAHGGLVVRRPVSWVDIQPTSQNVSHAVG